MAQDVFRTLVVVESSARTSQTVTKKKTAFGVHVPSAIFIPARVPLETGTVGTLADGQICKCLSGLLTSTGTVEAGNDDEFIICHLGSAGESLVMWVRGSVY